MMDYYGNVWRMPPEQFGGFYNSNANDFSFEGGKNNYVYENTNSVSYRKFTGWRIDNSNGNDKNILDLQSCDLGNMNGYKANCSGMKPRNEADGNYYKDDDKARFDKYANTRIFPNQIGGSGSYDTPPNSIPGYHRVSRNNNSAGSGEMNRVFNSGGFITIAKGSAYYDPAFLVFVLLRDKNRFADDILDNNPVLVKNILNSIYGLDEIKNCVSKNTPDACNSSRTDFTEITTDYVTDKIGGCRSRSDMGYDNLAGCDSLIGQSNTVTNKLIQYCIDNANDPSTNDYCLDALKANPSATDLYINKLCSIGDNINKNTNCAYLAPGGSVSVFNDDTRTYSKTLYENLYRRWCDISANPSFESGKWKYTDDPNDPACLRNWNYIRNGIIVESNIASITKAGDTKNWCPTIEAPIYTGGDNRKFTDDPNDPDCLRNWTYWVNGAAQPQVTNIPSLTTISAGKNWCMTADLSSPKLLNSLNVFNSFRSGNWKYTDDPKDPECMHNWSYVKDDKVVQTNIANITKSGDTKNWCATKSTPYHQQCDYLKRKASYTNTEDGYVALNTFWKSLGCLPDLPTNIYLKISTKPLNEQKSFLTSYATSANFISRNTCFTGEALEVGKRMFVDQCLFSQNKQYRMCLGSSGALSVSNAIDNTNVEIHPAVYGDQGHVLVMQTDGNLVQYSGNNPIWATMTVGNSGAFLVMRDDGKPVLYKKNGEVLKIIVPTPITATLTTQQTSQVQQVEAAKAISTALTNAGDQLKVATAPLVNLWNKLIGKATFTNEPDECETKSSDSDQILYLIVFVIFLVLITVYISSKFKAPASKPFIKSFR